MQPLSRVKCDISWDTKVPKRFWSPGLLKLSPVLWPAAAFSCKPWGSSQNMRYIQMWLRLVQSHSLQMNSVRRWYSQIFLDNSYFPSWSPPQHTFGDICRWASDQIYSRWFGNEKISLLKNVKSNIVMLMNNNCCDETSIALIILVSLCSEYKIWRIMRLFQSFCVVGLKDLYQQWKMI